LDLLKQIANVFGINMETAINIWRKLHVSPFVMLL
jgi:hypothetical protein